MIKVNGGYLIVDLEDKYIKTEGDNNLKIDGIFNTINNSTKPIMLCNVTIKDNSFIYKLIKYGFVSFAKDNIGRLVANIGVGADPTDTYKSTYMLYINNEDELYFDWIEGNEF